MADTVVSVVMEQATSFLAQKIEENVQLVVGTKKEVQKLSKTLGTIKKVLTDAEKKEVKDESVRDWLERLKDISYDAEDVLDEWNTAILKAQNEYTISGGPKSNKACSCFPSPSFRFSQICLRHKVGSKIKDIRETLDEIADEKKQFDFIPNGSVEEPDRLKTTSLIDVTEVCGRKMDKDTIVNKLLCESSQGERGLHIISIVGLGGIGKTTLARLAYNDDAVKAHFDKRIWVCVSDPFDQMSIARSILEALNGSAVQNFLELEIPLQQIQDSIMGKKLLLVLDDVWNEDSKRWEPLKLSLKCSGRGSRILVTTRNERVAKVIETTDMLHLEKLSEEDCWLLFRQTAFSGKGREECEKLEDIGKKIANRCKGLPLAAKTLGGLMQFKETKQDWENVLNSETWELEEVENDLFHPLLLSYYSLPSPVKCCFSYCAIFPKDFVIKKDDLIQLWMAQGFLSSKGNIDMERNGEKYFNNLVMRSFFQDFTKDKSGNIIRCKMHDIVHDFAQFLTNNECSIMEIDDERELSLKSPFNKVRHSTIMFQNFDTNTNFPPSIYEAKNLRTLRVQSTNYALIPSISFDSFMCLRTLNICDCGIEDLPSTVGKLIHLRYLDISSNLRLKELPETLLDLYNLQTLKLNYCIGLHKLPQGMRKLINLRHLEVEHCPGLTMPKGMGEMRFLRTLSTFIISDDSVDEEGCKFGELKNLNHLKGFLSLTGLHKVTNVREAVEAKLDEKKLHSLKLKFSVDFFTVKEDAIEVEALVIEALHPHPDLELLRIDDYAGARFPSWLISLPNLKCLELFICIIREHWPPLGKLPSLERLQLSCLFNLKSLGHEFLGIGQLNDHDETSKVTVFPKLQELTFSALVELEEWVDPSRKRRGDEEEEDSSIIIMPNLLSLKIENCNKLKALPDYVLKTPLRQLSISSNILNHRYKEQVGEDWKKISHIPTVRITEPEDFYADDGSTDSNNWL